ncbi:RagB/SusD family nutrient uptake outer membrane protein [Ohtaekwangia koreensis]|uniref:Starch-binding associating with outer membrane n=1 Tax=Ohtaekwangia koreensis TaxID=688867 RepID=A0A1T5MH96_9BACT|nr:RagB/SusD family nutrient uptake outer membrane protein [Ohtaekwangia koreensis]SKC87607.1 Starch-binding associating with outer membrane [Ohtaekwangia koreensis]
MKIRNILLAAIFLFTLSNCNDYLEEENKSDSLSDEIYKTADGYENLVKSVYSTLRDVYREPWLFMAGTDMYVEGRNAQPEGISEYNSLSPTEPSVLNFYTAVYKAIQRCNVAVHYNDLTEQTAKTSTRMGEVKFIRAYYYFLLVQSFGGVSLVEDMLTTPVTSFERNSAEEVYAFILAEMEESLNLLASASGQEFGRVTPRAVKHYLAKVHLTRGYETFAAADDFTKAAAYADDAISGYNLSSVSFENLFWPGKENNTEVLWSIQYDKTSLSDASNGGSLQSLYYGPYLGGEGAKFGYPYRSYTLLPTTYVYRLFNQNDVRWEGSFMNIFYERYYDFYDKAKSERANMNVRFYFPQSWEVADTAAWRATDVTHRGKTKIIPYQEATSEILTWERNVNVDNNTPAIRKFDDPTSVFSGSGSSTRDIYLARLAETYLIATEAYVKLGNATTAMERVNEVRGRAERTPGSLVLTDANQVTIDFILDERARELFGEYERWFDLKRTGKLKERTELYNKEIRDQYFRKGIDPFKGTNGQDKILRPIPQSAIDLNQNDDFLQNPGY